MEDYLLITGATQNTKYYESDVNMTILEVCDRFLSNYKPSQKDLINNYEFTNCTTVDYYINRWIESYKNK